MRSKGELLLFHVLFITWVYPTDYSRAANYKVPPSCQNRIVECGEFQPPSNQAARYECKINKKTCAVICVMKCPKTMPMTISNRRHAKEIYSCQAGIWRRRDTPQAYCIAQMPVKEVTQNFHHGHQLNTLVNTLFNTSFFYLGMASFYERADVALPGFSKLMTELWQTDLKLARDVMTYVNTRGGYITLYDIPRPSSHELLLLNVTSRPGLMGIENALDATRYVHGQVLDLHKAVMQNHRRSDPHLKHYLDDDVISPKVEAIKKLGDMLSRLRSFTLDDYSIGEYSIDVELNN